jgi:hypothetical protein
MGQEPTPPADGQAPPVDTPPEGTPPKTFDEDYVKTLRAEAAKHRKEAADAKARAAELENATLSETEKLKKEAEEGRKLAETATGKLRNANLRDALAEKGFTGPQAKAVTRLLSDLEYDGEDEPKNLDARLKAAQSEYGDIAKPGTTSFDGGAREAAPPNKTPEQAHQDFLSQVLSGAQPT